MIEKYIYIWTVVIMDKRKDNLSQMIKEEYMDSLVDYGALIIELVQQIDKSDYNFLKQVYTIIHRHIKKRGG